MIVIYKKSSSAYVYVEEWSTKERPFSKHSESFYLAVEAGDMYEFD